MVRDLIVDALTHNDGGRAWINRTNDRIHEITRFVPGTIGVEYVSDGSGRPVTYRLNGKPVDPYDIIHLRAPPHVASTSRVLLKTLGNQEKRVATRTRHEIRKPASNLLKIMVRLSGDESNQILAELADWEQLLRDTSLARPPKPPAP